MFMPTFLFIINDYFLLIMVATCRHYVLLIGYLNILISFYLEIFHATLRVSKVATFNEINHVICFKNRTCIVLEPAVIHAFTIIIIKHRLFFLLRIDPIGL